MAAITWRNVDAPSIGEASRAMYLGGMGINQGFDKLGEVLKQQEATNTANWNQQATNNTEAFYNTIAQRFNTPEKYQAGLDSGEINGLMSANGAQIDQAGARRFMDAQMGNLQKRAQAAGEYQDSTIDRAEAPVLNEVDALNARGEFTKAMERAGTLTRNQGKAAQATSAAQRAETLFQQGNVKFGNTITGEARQAEMHLRDLASKDADVTYKGALTNQANANAERDRADSAKDGKGAGKLNDAYIAELTKNSSFSAGTMDTKEGMDNFISWVNTNVKNSSEKEDILHNMSILAKEGIVAGKDKEGNAVKVPLPVSAAILSVGSATDSVALAPFWSRRGDDTRNIYEKYIKDNSQSILAEHYKIEDAKGNKYAPLHTPEDSKAKRALLTAKGAVLPPSVLDNAARLRLAAEDSGDDYGSGAPNPNLNDATWMEDQRNRAKAKNAKLSDDRKKLMNMPR